MSTDKIPSIVNKIRALLNLSKSSHSRAEQETAATMAQKLIAEYQISQLQIDIANATAAESDNLEGVVVFESGRTSAWKQQLVFGIAKLNGCYCLAFSGVRGEASHKRGTRFRVFGKPTDIELTQYMFDYLLHTIGELSQMYITSNHKRGVNTERESWCLGCVNGFLDKMTKERQMVLNQASQSTAMVLVNRPAEIKAKMLAKDTKLKIGSKQGSKASHNEDSYGSGFRKGQTMTVNPGVNAGSPHKRLS